MYGLDLWYWSTSSILYSLLLFPSLWPALEVRAGHLSNCINVLVIAISLLEEVGVMISSSSVHIKPLLYANNTPISVFLTLDWEDLFSRPREKYCFTLRRGRVAFVA